MQRTKSTKRAREKRGVIKEKAVKKETKRSGITDVHEIVFIRNPVMYRALQILPWLSMLLLILDLKVLTFWSVTNTAMFNSGLFLVIVGLFIFQRLARRVSQVFVAIRKRNIVGLPNDESSDLQMQYQEFLYKFEDLLNHPIQWMMGGVFAALVFVWQEGILVVTASYFHVLQSRLVVGLVGVFQGLMQFILAFVMGFLIWRMIVIGIYIWRIGKAFRINPQIGYPDACGGLEPVGNLCLWNILLIGLSSIYLGGWLIPSQIWDVGQDSPLSIWVQKSLMFSDLYPKLLLIVVAISVVSFFVPLWSIHQAMLRSRLPIKKEMEDLAQSIAEIERKLLDKAKTLNQKESDDLLKQLKTMQEIYQRNQKYPTWPFNTKGIIKFITVQLLPILVSLKLTDPIIKVIRHFLGLPVG